MSRIAFTLTLLLAAVLAAPPVLAERLHVLTSFPDAMTAPLVKAFSQRYPEVQVIVLNRKTFTAVSYTRERYEPQADLFWASTPEAFEALKADGLLKPIPDLVRSVARPLVAGRPVDDPDGFFLGFALSGYGLMWNTDYLRRHDLPVPEGWADLKNPGYRGHIGFTTPSRSGTTHLVVEAILQQQGWDAGWATLLEIGGNLAAVTARSYGIMEGVKQGWFGVGPVIDFFGLASQTSGAPVGFAYAQGTIILPASVGLLATARNERDARRFIAFLLSDEGQRLLLEPQIRRLPVAPTVYAEAPAGYPNPYASPLADTVVSFDMPLSQRRYEVVNSLFDHLVTFRLRALARLWQALHEAEAVMPGDPLLAEARARLTRVPVSAELAGDPEFASRFSSRHRSIGLPAEQMAIEHGWAQRIEEDAAAAKALIGRTLANHARARKKTP